MTPRQRVLAALPHQEVNEITWIEGIVGNGIASAVCGAPVALEWAVEPDDFPAMSGEPLADEQKKTNRVPGKANLQFLAFAAVFCGRLRKADDMKPENAFAMRDAICKCAKRAGPATAPRRQPRLNSRSWQHPIPSELSPP